LRLSLHLARRNLGKGEDFRYVRMRERFGARFWIVSLFVVFLLQAGLAWTVSLPIQAGQIVGSEQPLGPLDGLGFGVWLVGLVFETVGDGQLARFRADPTNRGRVLDRGLWRYTRHPNYFGDFCVWWGLWLIAVSAGAPWSVIGPLLMSVLLIRVSGKGLLERTIGERRPGYADYVDRTSGFFPLPPKRR
jgi:steroid 5-alpha reductase family enzyme